MCERTGYYRGTLIRRGAVGYRCGGQQNRGGVPCGPVSECESQRSTGRVGFTTAPGAGVSTGPRGPGSVGEHGPGGIFKAGTVGSSLGPSLATDRCTTAATFSSSRSSDIPIAFSVAGVGSSSGQSAVRVAARYLGELASRDL